MVGEAPDRQRERYSRHLLLPQIGATGQEQLAQARVLVVGAGGLGAPVLTYLAAAGVGTLAVIDDDQVELSNLQRQVIHKTAAVGESKAASAAQFIADLNPNTTVIPIEDRLRAGNVFEIIADYDIIVDGTDNFATRYLLNDACVVTRKPYVWAAIFQFNAMVSIFQAGLGPCYRCIYPTPPPPGSVPSCAEGGVIGALPGLVGTTQALETIKLITDAGTPLRGTLASFDGLRGQWEYIPVAASPHCPSCAPGRKLTAREVLAQWGEPESDDMTNPWLIQPRDLENFLTEHDAQLVDVRTPAEISIVAIPGSRNIELDEILENGDIGPTDRTAVIMCRSGVRSAHAAQALRARGYDRIYELDGGILEWVAQVAPDKPTY